MGKKMSLVTLGSFLLAIVIGTLFPGFCGEISFLGDIYINLLKMMMIPVLFVGIVSALLTKGESTGRITVKTIVLFIIMFVVSFLICCGLWAILKPGIGYTFDEIVWEGELASTSFGSFLTNLFPNNILKSMTENAILPVILFAFAFGIIGKRYDSSKVLTKLFGTLNKVFNKMLYYIMYLTPIGVFALMSNTVANYGSQILGQAAIYIGCAYLGCIVIMILVMILPVWIYCKVNPIEYIKRAYKIWLITLSTCSSAATLPNTIKLCNEEFNIPSEITDIVVPLGCTIHMCGGAVSFSLLAMFNMQMMGIPMSLGLFIIMIVVALLLNMGAPGIPGGGIVIGATYLSVLGIPLNFIGFYAGIYRLLDMAYTTMNVTGDITANLIIERKEYGRYKV